MANRHRGSSLETNMSKECKKAKDLSSDVTLDTTPENLFCGSHNKFHDHHKIVS